MSTTTYSPSSSTSSTKSNASSVSNSEKQLSASAGDSGFVAYVSSTSSSSSGSSTKMAASSGGSSSTNRGRKNPQPKRRLTASEESSILQQTTQLIIPRKPFARLVREIVNNFNSQLLIQKEAYEAIQESAEMYVVQIFQDAFLLAQHRRCITVEPKDINLVQRIQSIEQYRYNDETNENTKNTSEEETE